MRLDNYFHIINKIILDKICDALGFSQNKFILVLSYELITMTQTIYLCTYLCRFIYAILARHLHYTRQYCKYQIRYSTMFRLMLYISRLNLKMNYCSLVLVKLCNGWPDLVNLILERFVKVQEKLRLQDNIKKVRKITKATMIIFDRRRSANNYTILLVFVSTIK